MSLTKSTCKNLIQLQWVEPNTMASHRSKSPAVGSVQDGEDLT